MVNAIEAVAADWMKARRLMVDFDFIEIDQLNS
jgi:hypothetical protein